MSKYRAKRCLECHSMSSADAPYCDACGYQFRARPETRRWKYRLAAALTGLAVAVARQYLAG